MWHSALKLWRSGSVRTRPLALRRLDRRLTVEHLEDRTVPSTFNAGTVSDLIADINAANHAGGANTIVLTAPTTAHYDLTAVNNTTDGATGLPVIKRGALTVVGNGDTIERASGAPSFRLFDVAQRAVVEVKLSDQPRYALEVALLKGALLAPGADVAELIARVEALAAGEPAPSGGGPSGPAETPRGEGDRPAVKARPAPTSRSRQWPVRAGRVSARGRKDDEALSRHRG